jgi:hypothetical protein
VPALRPLLCARCRPRDRDALWRHARLLIDRRPWRWRCGRRYGPWVGNAPRLRRRHGRHSGGRPQLTLPGIAVPRPQAGLILPRSRRASAAGQSLASAWQRLIVRRRPYEDSWTHVHVARNAVSVRHSIRRVEIWRVAVVIARIPIVAIISVAANRIGYNGAAVIPRWRHRFLRRRVETGAQRERAKPGNRVPAKFRDSSLHVPSVSTVPISTLQRAKCHGKRPRIRMRWPGRNFAMRPAV